MDNFAPSRLPQGGLGAKGGGGGLVRVGRLLPWALPVLLPAALLGSMSDMLAALLVRGLSWSLNPAQLGSSCPVVAVWDAERHSSSLALDAKLQLHAL
eukprot:gene14540-14668_t